MARLSKKVFLAPDVLFAFIDRAHSQHEQAAAYFRYFAENEYSLFIDTVSLNDVYAKIQDNISPSLAKDFLRVVALSTLNILTIEESDLRSAIKTLVAASQSPDLTFSKALIAVLSSKRSIPQICTLEYLHPLFGVSLFYLPI